MSAKEKTNLYIPLVSRLTLRGCCFIASTPSSLYVHFQIQLVNEMLQGIRAIKFYNWETPFKERVEKIHDDELEIFKKAVTKRSLVVSVLSTTPAIVIAVTLGLYRCLHIFILYSIRVCSQRHHGEV